MTTVDRSATIEIVNDLPRDDARYQGEDVILIVDDDLVDYLRESGKGINGTADVTEPTTIAMDRLDEHGWEVPASLYGGGQVLPQPDQTLRWADDLLHAILEAHPQHADALVGCSSGRWIANACEAMLADLIIPTPNGLRGDHRVGGEQETVRDRVVNRQNLVEGFPAASVNARLDDHRERAIDLARDLLTTYLDRSIESGSISSTALHAVASTLEPSDTAERVVWLTRTVPPLADVALVEAIADRSIDIHLYAMATAAHPTAWPCQLTRISDYLEQSDIAVSVATPDRPLPCAGYSVDGDDPYHSVLKVVSNRIDDRSEPSEIDVVVPSRRDARRLSRLGTDASVPFGRRGQIEPFRTAPAVLGRAWLRIIEGQRADHGWAVVLEAEGCSAGDIEAWLDRETKPSALVALRSTLAGYSGAGVIATVANRYGCSDRATGSVLRALGDAGRGRQATLAAIDHGFDHHVTARIEPPPPGTVTVATADDLPRTDARTIVRLTDSNVDHRPPLVYRPPLGLQWRTTVTETAHGPMETTRPAWDAMTSLGVHAGPTDPSWMVGDIARDGTPASIAVIDQDSPSTSL